MDKDYFLMFGFSLEEAEERAGYSYVADMSEESFEERYLRGMMEVAEARKEAQNEHLAHGEWGIFGRIRLNGHGYQHGYSLG